MKVVFANTGLEHEKTLEFINNCDKYFNFGTIWVEAKQKSGRQSAEHSLVTFETASRKGQPFEEAIRKYGIPNMAYPACTRDLKLAPINSLLKELGWGTRGSIGGYTTAIGIRTDESRRVSKLATKNKIIYPLIDMFPSDKQDILDWWEDQVFDLDIPEHMGNCKTCWKKSTNKLVKVFKDDPHHFDFMLEMEEKYPMIGAEFKKDFNAKPRHFMRRDISIINFIDFAKSANANFENPSDVPTGCSESCEIYETILTDQAL